MIYLDKKELDIAKIADSGQCFRMKQIEDRWLLVSGRELAFAKENEDSLTIDSDDEAFWNNYFDMQTDYEVVRNSIDPDDAYLTAAAKYGQGIRILRQDPWEMLISFIISQRKNIPAISSSITRICGGESNAFPQPSELAEYSDERLCACGLGYRVPYVHRAAEDVATGKLNLSALGELSDEALLKELMGIYGVGIKVANCVSLFGYHRVGAFPIDVWIKRVLEQHYPEGFPLDRYQGFAGILQQYMFFAARSGL